MCGSVEVGSVEVGSVEVHVQIWKYTNESLPYSLLS